MIWPRPFRQSRKGAFDVVEKPFKEHALLERIHEALAVSKKWKAIEAERTTIKERLARLSPRELEVLDLMVGGRRNIEIAKHLGISRKTLRSLERSTCL